MRARGRLAAAAVLLLGCVAPARAQQVEVTPASLVTTASKGATAALALDLALPSGPVTGVLFLAETSFGTISPVEETGPGRYEAELSVPPGDMPRVALVVLSPQNRPEVPVAYRLVPVSVETLLEARTEPRTRVEAVVGGRRFGPVDARRDGTFSLRFVLPPGTLEAQVRLTDVAGNVTKTVVPVPVRRHDALTVTMDRYRVTSDGLGRARVFAFVFDRLGRPVPGVSVRATASGGEIGAFADDGNGVHVASFVAPADASDRIAVLEVSAEVDVETFTERESVRIARGLPASLRLSADPVELVATGDTEVELLATVADAAGHALAGQPVSLHAERGRLSEVREDGAGAHRATLEVPREVHSGTLEVKALLAVGDPTSLPARLDVAANPKVVPTSWQAFSLVTVTVTDGEGAPVAGEVVLLHVARGEGTVTPVAVTNADGRAFADFAADPTDEVVTIAATSTSAPSLSARTTIEKRSSGAFAIVARPAIAAQGGPPSGVVVVSPDRRVLQDTVLLTLRPGTAARLVASADPDRLRADGESTARVEAVLTDSLGNGIPGATLAFAPDRGTVSDVADTGDGRYVATYTAPAGAGPGRAVVVVRDEASGLSATAPIALEVGPPAQLALAADRGRVPADGVSRVALVATVSDATGSPVAGAPVELAAEGVDVDLEAIGATGADGRAASGLVAGLTAGDVEVIATVPGTDLSARVTVELLPMGPVTLEATARPDRILADSQQRSDIEVVVEDAQGSVMADQVIDFTVRAGAATLSAPWGRTDSLGIARIFLTGQAAGPAVVRARSRTVTSLWDDVTVELVAPDKPPLAVGIELTAPPCAGAVALRATGDEAASWDWDWSGDGIADASGQEVTAALPAAADPVRVTLTAADATGRTGAAQLDVVVLPPPQAVATVSPPLLPTGGSATLDATGSRAADGGALAFAWDTDADGVDDRTGAVVTDWVMPPGTHVARLTVTDGAGCSARATVSATWGERPDLNVTKSLRSAPDPVPAGTVVTYDVRWANDGLGAAESVRVTDTLTGPAVVAGALPAGCVEVSAGRVQCALGSVAAGASGTFGYSVRVADTLGVATASVTNCATIASVTPDANPGDNGACVGLNAVEKLDLQVLHVASTSCPVRAGDRFDAAFRVRNVSARDADGATVELTWDETTLTRPVITPPATVLMAGRAEMDLGPLASGAARDVSVSFTVASVLASTSEPIRVDAVAILAGVDANPDDNDAATPPCSALAAPDVWVRATAEPDALPLYPGGTVTTTIEYGNEGTTAATLVSLVDRLDLAVVDQLVDNPDGGVLVGSDLEFFRGTVPAGPPRTAAGAIRFRLRLRGDVAPGVVAVVDEITADLAEVDGDPGDNTARTRLDLSRRPSAPDVRVALSQQGAATAGQALQLVLRVENVGTASASGVVVTHDLAGALAAVDGASLPPEARLTPTGVALDVGALAAATLRTFTYAVLVADPQAAVNPTLSSALLATLVEADANPADNAATLVSPVDAMPDLAVDLAVSPDPLAPGGVLRLSATVRSQGAAPSSGGTLDLAWDPLLLVGGPTVTVAVPGLPVGAALAIPALDVPAQAVVPSRSNTVSVTARVTCADGDRAPANDTTTASASLPAVPDLAVAILPRAASTPAGQPLVVDVTCRNGGTTAATGVYLRVVTDATVFQPLGLAPIALGTVPAGGVTLLTPLTLQALPVQSAPSTTGTLLATLTQLGADANPADDTAVATLPVTAAPDLRLDLATRAQPDPAAPSGLLTYTVTVANAGTTRAALPRLTLARAPASLMPALVPPFPSGLSSDAAGVTTLDLPTIRPGDPPVVRDVTYLVAASLPQPTVTVTTDASVTDQEGLDPDLSDNARSATTPLGAVVDLAVSLTLRAQPADLGASGSVLATMYVANTSATDASGVDVSATYPDLATLVQSVTSVSPGGADDGAGTVRWTGLSVPAGDTLGPLAFTFQLRPTLPALSNIVPVTSQVTSAAPESDLADNVDTEALVAVARPDLCVSLQATTAPSPPAPGAEIVYAMSVENRGTTAASPVTVRLRLDPSLLPAVVDDGGGRLVPPDALEWDLTDVQPGAVVALPQTRFALVDPLPAPTVTVAATAEALALPAAEPGECPRTGSASFTVSTLPDLALTKSLRPLQAPPLRGTIVEYTLVVTNVGNAGATGGTVLDTFPPGLLVDDPGSGIVLGSSIAWSLPALPVGVPTPLVYQMQVDPTLGPGIYDLVNTARVTSNDPDGSAANDVASATISFRFEIDLIVTLTCRPSPSPAAAGSLVDYVAEVRNIGSYDASNVTLQLDLGPLLTLATPPVGGVGAGPVTVSLGTIPSAGTRLVPFSARVLASLPDATNVVDVMASVSATEADADPSTDADSCRVDVPAQPDLRVSLQASDADGALPLQAGEDLFVTVAVSNVGSQDATPVDVVVTFDPAVAALVDAGDFTPGADPRTLTATLPGPLAGGGTSVTVLRFTLRGGSPLPLPTNLLRIDAVASCPFPDAYPPDNADALSVLTTALPDLLVTLTATPSRTPALPGDLVRYTVTVENRGDTAAPGVVVVHDRDEAVTGALVFSTPPGTDTGTAVTWAVGTLDVGQTWSADHDIPIAPTLPSLNGVVTATATATSSLADRNAADDTDTATVPYVALPDAWVTLGSTPAAPGPVVPGADLTYTIDFGNRGTSPVRTPVLVLTLPAEITVVDGGGGSQAGNTITFVGLPDLLPTDATTRVVACRVSAVLPDATNTLTATATVTYADTPSDAVPADNSATLDMTATAAANLVVTLQRQTAAPVPGGDVFYAVTWRNDGSTTARSATLTVVEDPTLADRVVIPAANLGDIAPGAPAAGAAIQLRVKRPLAQPSSSLATQVVVSSPTPESFPADNTATDVVTITALPDLRITALATQAAPDPPAPGGTVGVDVTWDNQPGDTTARSSVLFLDYDANAVSVVSTSGGGVDSGAGRVTWTLGDVPGASGPATVSVALQVRAVLALPSVPLPLSAEIQCADTEDDATNNAMVAVLGPVMAYPDLQVTVTPSLLEPSPASAGGRVTYRLDVENAGSTRATGVTLRVQWDAAIVASADPDPTAPDTADSRTWTLGQVDVAPGSPVSRTIRLNLAATMPDVVNALQVTGTVAGLEAELVAGNNTATSTINVGAAPDLRVVSTVTPTTAAPQAGTLTTVQYEHEVTNVGSAPAQDTVIDAPYDSMLLRHQIGGTNLGGSLYWRQAGSLPPGAIMRRTSWFEVLDLPPPPVQRIISRDILTREESYGTARDANPADNVAAVTLTGCYLDVTVTTTTVTDTCLGSSVTLAATTKPAQGLTYAWTAPGGGTLTGADQKAVLYEPPQVAGSYVVWVTVTDPVTGCAASDSSIVTVTSGCTACGCQSARVNLKYEGGSLERTDQPASSTVEQGETVSFRVRVRETNNSRSAILLGGPGRTKFEFGQGATRYTAWLAHDTYVECQSVVVAEFDAQVVPAGLDGRYTARFTWVTDDSVSGPPCGSIDSAPDASNPDDVIVVPPGTLALDPAIDFTDWGPKRGQTPFP